MAEYGLFETKTRLSEICDTVARSGEPVTVTRRGKPLVRIEPIDAAPTTIRERRVTYMARYAGQEGHDTPDFEPPRRSREAIDFHIED